MPTPRRSKPLPPPGANPDRPTAGQDAPNVPAQWRKHYHWLVERREQLLQRQADLAREAVHITPLAKLEIADSASDTHDRDLTLGQLSSERESLYQIDHALRRIENGTYGICELTGRPIERERLEALPWTRHSAEAERQLEHQRTADRAAADPRNTAATTTPAGHESSATR